MAGKDTRVSLQRRACRMLDLKVVIVLSNYGSFKTSWEAAATMQVHILKVTAIINSLVPCHRCINWI
jgi:hypothetical protein